MLFLKKDVNNLFRRVRDIEVSQGKADERDKHMLEKLDDTKSSLAGHVRDEKQDQKQFKQELRVLSKAVYMGIGIVSLIGFIASFIGFGNIRTFLIG